MSYSLAFWHAVTVVTFIGIKMESNRCEFLTTSHISDYLDIPHSTVRKILKQLTTAGLIETKEGAKGGVLLTKSPSNLTLLDVFEAVEVQSSLFKIGKIIDNDKAIRMANRVKFEIESSMYDINKRLKTVTIQDILNE